MKRFIFSPLTSADSLEEKAGFRQRPETGSPIPE